MKTLSKQDQGGKNTEKVKKMEITLSTKMTKGNVKLEDRKENSSYDQKRILMVQRLEQNSFQVIKRIYSILVGVDS